MTNNIYVRPNLMTNLKFHVEPAQLQIVTWSSPVIKDYMIIIKDKDLKKLYIHIYNLHNTFDLSFNFHKFYW